MNQKPSYYLILSKDEEIGIGECGILPGLSVDDRDDYEAVLDWLVMNIDLPPTMIREELKTWPSILFGWEQASLQLERRGDFRLWDNSFSAGEVGQVINGLIWMGDIPFMKEQVQKRLEEGFQCLKMKIGAIDLGEEMKILQALRKEYPSDELEIRVDANGAFKPNEVPRILDELNRLQIHSIEQPIRSGQWQEMAKICEDPAIPVCLDEELIGVFEHERQIDLANTIKPQYFILKPSLIGGFENTLDWIDISKEVNAGWWITSALESNIGLNAIAQFTATLGNPMPQGLGTGSLYTNNIPSPLHVSGGKIWYDPSGRWDLSLLNM